MNFHDDDKGQQQTSDLLLLPFQILVSSRFLGTRIIVEQVGKTLTKSQPDKIIFGRCIH